MRPPRGRSSRQSANGSLLAAAICLSMPLVVVSADQTPNPVPTDPTPAEATTESIPAEQYERVRGELEAVTAQLVEAYRRLFLRLPEAERSAFLAEMMSRGVRPAPEEPNGAARLPFKVRELAYDLATAEVVSARPLGPALVEAASLGLSDEQAQIRAKAAGLLAKLDASAVIDRVREALLVETQPAPAAEMLTVVARHPGESSRGIIASWLKKPNLPVAVRIAALDAALSHQREFPFEDPEELDLVRATIDSLSPDELTANTVRLLMELGDIERVRSLVRSDQERIARAAAAELVQDADSLDTLLQRAQEIPALYEFAVECVRLHQPTATGFRRASELPAPSPEKRAELLTRLASALEPSELLTVASLPMDLAERERYLSTIATPEKLELLATPEYRTEDRRLLLESLVRTRLLLKNATGALRVIQGLPVEARSATLVQDEVAALIWLNRLDEAVARSESLGNPIAPDVWLTTLEKIEAMDHAPDALARFNGVFAGSLTESQGDRLAALSERLASLHPVPETPDGDGVADQENTIDPDAGVVDDSTNDKGDAEAPPVSN